MSEPDEVVDAELVEDDHLPIRRPDNTTARPLVDLHTILVPGQPIPTEADQPTYTEADLRVSEATAERLKNKSKPVNTSRTYDNQRDLFRRWCETEGRVARPCTTATYVEYVAHLIDDGRAPNAISVAMSAIRTWMPDDKKPGTTEARGMLNEYRKEWNKRVGVKKAPAITDAMLQAMIATCDLEHPNGIRDRCVLLLGRGALNRRIELADLTIGNVTVEAEGVALWISASKTDQEAKGEETFIPADDDPLLDPVAATRAWLNVLHQLGVHDGAFLRALTREGRLQSRVRATNRGEHVTGDAINTWVRGRAQAAGLPGWKKVTAHGLRRGGAQAIADADGDPTSQGRWKAGSAVVKREYLDRAQNRGANPWLKVQEKRRSQQKEAE
ncbi:tyrosine-type recombinase/integrase [Streptantibioticus silvisoli]|uniref:Tyrosine-type recombinase/integrase n=1 Tax=Streptantibioticus silvisoli TaxID=2705255 RepID=A0ABT6W4L6_9ACTN|nr:tyrosine-type recombinase/integrase [Streptantibioticus silvisoli]MDI5965700.1 tyrosine-type recombinase/integrase [Streptantibioticus silvisoli]